MAEKTGGMNGAAAKPATVAASKMDAVRQALAKHGRKVMPAKIQKFLKEEFSIEMSRAAISNYKSEILRKKRRKGKRAAAKVEAPTAVAKAVHHANGKREGGIPLDDIGTVKALVGRVGAETLKKLINLVAK